MLKHRSEIPYLEERLWGNQRCCEEKLNRISKKTRMEQETSGNSVGNCREEVRISTRIWQKQRKTQKDSRLATRPPSSLQVILLPLLLSEARDPPNIGTGGHQVPFWSHRVHHWPSFRSFTFLVDSVIELQFSLVQTRACNCLCNRVGKRQSYLTLRLFSVVPPQASLSQPLQVSLLLQLIIKLSSSKREMDRKIQRWI